MKSFKQFSETKEKSKKKSTKRGVRLNKNSDAKRDSMRAGRRNYGQGKGK